MALGQKRELAAIFFDLHKHSTLCPIGPCWTNLNHGSDYLIKWIMQLPFQQRAACSLGINRSFSPIRNTLRTGFRSATFFFLIYINELANDYIYLEIVCANVFCIRSFLAQTIEGNLVNQPI